MAVGVGAWAAYGFLTTGPQPSEALPADTLGYVSIDLDPSGGQKIEALKTLNKFPAFKDYVGISPDDDLVKTLFDKIQDEAGCDSLDYEDDIEPWVGDRAAVAGVDLGGDTPEAVFVVQVKDAEKAEAGLDKIKDCSGGDEGGWAIEGDWAIVAESDKIADKVVAETKKGSLADDEDFKKWTGEAGDPGVMTMYAGPEAGDYLADHADDLFGFPLGMVDDYACSASPDDLGDEGDVLGDDESAATTCPPRTSPTTSGTSSATSRAWPRPSGSTTAPSSSRPPATPPSVVPVSCPVGPRPTSSRRCPATPAPHSGSASQTAGSPTWSNTPPPTWMRTPTRCWTSSRT